MNSVLHEIGEYIRFLKDDCHMNVTIHSTGSGVLKQLMGVLAPYNIHSTGYCMCMKTNRDIWDKCIANQKKVIEHLSGGEFFGMCYLGVSEFVYPIEYSDELVGFICVSGYRCDNSTALSKIKHASAKYGLDATRIKELYMKELSPDIPSGERVETLVFPLICMLRLYCADSEMESGKASVTFSGGDSYIYGHILTYINRHYSEHISIADLCTLCHCSPSHVSHVFSKLGGCGIIEYINNLRIKEAKAMLAGTQLLIREIAFNVGFNDSNYFTNVFRQKVGMSPKGYREKVGFAGQRTFF